MHILLVAVGRAKQGPETALFAHYAGRITWPFTLQEVVEKKKLSGSELMEREGTLLLGQVPTGAKVVVLDERGKTFGSRQLATKLGTWRDQGCQDVVFLIGGADGHGDAVRQRADLILSFGAMTWPHMLVRPMVAEQVYRAQCILSGHPYHRD